MLESSFVDEVVDRFTSTATVSQRKMFGGAGIFHNGLMIALIADNELYLKTDQQSRPLFEDRNLHAFSYRKAGGKSYRMSYHQAPDSFFEDEQQTRLWTERAIAAATRAATDKRKKASPDG